MNKQARDIQYFLYSQYFSDGLRITLGVLLPSLIASQFNQFAVGLTLSLGALCVSITDSPGPLRHKRNAMMLCVLTIFVVSLITGFARMNPYVLGVEIVAFSWFFSMFMVYGNRAAALGTAGLIVMILMMDTVLKPFEILIHSLLILAGGVWYMLLSLFFFGIRPYRQAQQALGECMHEVAKFLRLKAAFYDPKTDIEKDYQRVVSQQIVVSEKQDAVREVLFKTRAFIKSPTVMSRLLVLTFVDLVDLYEQITTTHYDYDTIREKFEKTGVLKDISDLILEMAEHLDAIGFFIQANTRHRALRDLSSQLEKVKATIDAIAESDKGNSTLALKKVLVNLRNLNQRLTDIQQYFTADQENLPQHSNALEFSRFVSQQDHDLKLFRDNLTFSSAAFKHALRVSLVCLFGYLVTKVFHYGHHSYWVLLTIIVILKPAFSLTKQRNYQRIVGTLAGGAIGILIVVFIPNKIAQFIFLLIFMVGTYSFQRINYVISVIFMTPFVLILFNFLGAGNLNIAEERIIDTLIGSAIAFTASYLIFPSWESEQILQYQQKMLEANLAYLQKLAEVLSGKKIYIEDYKLARKHVYVHSANLSAAFQRMMSEPKRKQKKAKEVQKFVVLNHILSSFIATLASGLLAHPPQTVHTENIRSVRRSLGNLHEALRKLGITTPSTPAESQYYEPETQVKTVLNPDENLLKEQLAFIYKICSDIRKVTEAMIEMN
jgi:YccS/YhfK family integral membrane protein